MRHILKFPKLLVFFASIVFAYVLYKTGAFFWMEAHLDGASYPSMLLAGFLFSFGFTSPLAAAYFFEVAHVVNPFIAAILAAIGATLSDISIFQFTKLSFHDEILRLKETTILRRLHAIFHREYFSHEFRNALRWILACVVIASPLPDEIGMTFIVGFTHLKGWKLSTLCFVLNAIGIFVIMMLGRAGM
ncbi:MAG: Uncharacterized protein Greene041662_57 [Candidatus Peregrinibacteria bacterium Greene0416_62]|nr:MAG: Uncharacterized protein Greene041662_57 [Candidatus Peregrinibacteria bacterium Greene0416_62]